MQKGDNLWVLTYQKLKGFKIHALTAEQIAQIARLMIIDSEIWLTEISNNKQCMIFLLFSLSPVHTRRQVTKRNPLVARWIYVKIFVPATKCFVCNKSLKFNPFWIGVHCRSDIKEKEKKYNLSPGVFSLSGKDARYSS